MIMQKEHAIRCCSYKISSLTIYIDVYVISSINSYIDYFLFYNIYVYYYINLH